MTKKVVFLGMGGTIAGTAKSAGDNVGYTAAQVGVQQLLDAVPGLQGILGTTQVVSEQVCQIDSKDLAHADWLALLERASHHLSQSDVAGVVVTHGTDTLEETAYFLSRTLPAALLKNKPLVLTCAMRPASSLTPDGPGNMADATTVALSGQARGVVVVCAGKIHGAAQVQKVFPYRVDAFDSGEAGPLGLVEEGSIRLLGAWPHDHGATSPFDNQRWAAKAWPRVEVVLSHAGASGALVRALLASHGDQPALQGLVVAGTGNGTIHKEMLAALGEAQARGVRVVRVSRCAYGQIVDATTSTGNLTAMGLSPVKARIALMLELMK